MGNTKDKAIQITSEVVNNTKFDLNLITCNLDSGAWITVPANIKANTTNVFCAYGLTSKLDPAPAPEFALIYAYFNSVGVVQNVTLGYFKNGNMVGVSNDMGMLVDLTSNMFQGQGFMAGVSTIWTVHAK